MRGLIISLILTAGMAIAAPAFSYANNHDGKTATQYRELGLLYRQQERFAEAISALEKSVELAPRDVSGRIILGWTLHLATQRSAAARELLAAVYLNPLSVQAFNALGIVYLVKGDLPQAVLSHSWAVLLKPDNEIGYYNLSLAYHRQQIFQLAVDCAERAAALEPDNPHPLVAMAIAYWDDGERASAIQAYRQAINLDSRYGNVAFLIELERAGFSPAQIQTSSLVMAAVTQS